MNGLDQSGIPGEGLECGSIRGLEPVTALIQLRGQVGELLPGRLIRQRPPDPLDRVECRTVGWPPHTVAILRPAEPLRGVGAAVLQEQKIAAIRTRLGTHIEEALKHLRIHIWPF
jgi:hypothetical protein